MLIVADRSVPDVFAAADTVTRPELETLAQVTCGHGSPDEALHSHDVEPVTSTLAAPPRAGRFIVAAESVNPLHPAAGWVMITVCPLIVIVPVRGSVVLFGEAVNESELFPEPELLDSRSQPALVDADQSQFEVTLIVPLAPAAPIVIARVFSDMLHAAAA